MASFINMSLDDIIQRKKNENFRKTNKIKKTSPIKKSNASNVFDARNKIISKKRTQIADARDKLAELAKRQDARLRLEHNRAKRLALTKHQEEKVYHNREKFIKPYYKKERVFSDQSRHVVSQPINTVKRLRTQVHQNRKFMESRSVAKRPVGNTTLKPIIRTIENDLEHVHSPIEEYEPIKPTNFNRKTSLQLKIVTDNSNERTNYLREKSPPRLPSILKKRPIAALRSDQKAEQAEKPVLECRIIVSNLRNSVTGGDIEELFGDVGGMLESRLVRPGTAEVIYKSVEDAQRAVDLYHNRQLDGQPMNCLLVTPRTNASATRSSNKPALYSTNSNVEPDISTFHKVLFSNF